MGLCGAVGVLMGEHPERSRLMWIWTMGTLLVVPWVAQQMILLYGRPLARGGVVYVLAQSLVIIFDLIAAQWSHGKIHLGLVTEYHHAGQESFWRPHAWYQEPGYFAGFMLISQVYLILVMQTEEHPVWRRVFLATQLISLVALAACTSRVGWIGLGVLGLFWIFRFLSGRFKRFKISNPRVFILPAALLLLLAIFSGKGFSNYLVKGFLNPLADQSFSYRFLKVSQALEVFKDNPFFGAGPGGAGFYFVEHFSDTKLSEAIEPATLGYMRHDPLAQSIYLELLSEWGLYGSFFFALGLLYLTRRVKFGLTWLTRGIIIVIYLSAQSLPRFDLWWMIASIWALSRHAEAKQ